ncbi:MAG: class I SAM-dependent methyltransferase [Deltaproteobacteria bacterium]
MRHPEPSRLIKLLTRLRDSRLLWDLMGSIYNRHIYDAITELYDHIASLPEMRGQTRMLDVGAGRGYLSVLLAFRNPDAQVTGIDYSHRQVRDAENYRVQGKILNCSFLQANAMALPFADETFNAAASVGSIKHWPDGLRGLAEIRRVLKPGGHLLVSETDQEASDDALRRFINRFRIWYIPDRLLYWGLRQVIFGQSYSEAALARSVAEAGFRDIECRRVPACPYVIVKARK